jgi:large subunit ribosomal protein L30
MEKKKIRVTLVKSPIRRHATHKACVTGLGLRKIRSSALVEDTPAIRGMINKISYMLVVEE